MFCMKRFIAFCLLLCLAIVMSSCALFKNSNMYEPHFLARLDTVECIELVYYDAETLKRSEQPMDVPTELYNFEKSETIEVLNSTLTANFLAELDKVKFCKHSATPSATKATAPASYSFRIVYKTGEFEVFSFRYNSFMCHYDVDGHPLYVEADIYYHDDNFRKLQSIANAFFETPM